jgi:hypothetical protein
MATDPGTTTTTPTTRTDPVAQPAPADGHLGYVPNPGPDTGHLGTVTGGYGGTGSVRPLPPMQNAGIPTAVDYDAKALISNALDAYGLATLGDWAWQRYIETGSTAQVMLELQGRQEYKDRFPAMAALAAKGQAITPGAYVAYERQVSQLLHQYGVPAGMYDTREGIASLLTNNVDTPEINQRLQIASNAAFKAPQEVRDALSSQYGVSAGGLIGWFLDPDKAEPLLEQQFAAAQVTGAARAQQVMIDKETSERLAAQGVSYAGAQQGFGQVQTLNALEGGTGETIGQGALIDAAFGDANAQARVTRIQKGRAAGFQGGGGAAASNSGVVGLGR